MVEPDGNGGGEREIEVWDTPTRVCHWLLVVLVVLEWATSAVVDVGGSHRFVGYAFLATILFRAVWGVVGSRHSRFSDFVTPWSAVRDHCGRLLHRRPSRSVGLNPLGGWLAVLLLAALFLVALSGLFATGGGDGPLADLLPRRFGRAAAAIHAGMFVVVVVLVAMHLLAIAADSLLTRENLVRAMWTGRKWLPERLARGERPPVPALWAVPVGATAMAVVWLALS